MRARPVPGLDAKARLDRNARRIVRVRLDELYSFVPAALDPQQRKAQHDMRIAAKRLRYVLELTSFCFGRYAAKAGAHARDLQDLLGAIHDCDVLEPRIVAHIAALRAGDAKGLYEAALRDGGVEPASTPAPRRATLGALEALAIDQQARRALCFERFRRRWEELQRGRFRERLLAALDEAPTAG